MKNIFTTKNLIKLLSLVAVAFPARAVLAVTDTYTFFGNNVDALNYINIAYTWGSGVAGATALIVITYAGINYSRAMGNSEIISSSKTLITGALIGLFLVIGSYFILNVIDPRLVELKLVIPQVQTQTAGLKTTTPCSSVKDTTCTSDLDCNKKIATHCSYQVKICISNAEEGNKYSDPFADDTVKIVCRDSKCVSESGFCGVAPYGNDPSFMATTSDSKYGCASCQIADHSVSNPLKWDALCPKGTQCGAIGPDLEATDVDYINQYPNTCLIKVPLISAASAKYPAQGFNDGIGEGPNSLKCTPAATTTP